MRGSSLLWSDYGAAIRWRAAASKMSSLMYFVRKPPVCSFSPVRHGRTIAQGHQVEAGCFCMLGAVQSDS